jgi:hypothetical protein
MNVTPLVQKLILTALILAGLGYVAFTTFTSDVPVGEDGLPVVEVVGQEVLSLADQLEGVEINKTIFSSPIFTSLVDVSVPVVEEPKGRNNPFAPIGSESDGTSARVR